MKKCKHCQSEIDDKARVCPNCGKKQGKPILLIIIIVIIIIAVIATLGGGGETENEPSQTGLLKRKKI